MVSILEHRLHMPPLALHLSYLPCRLVSSRFPDPEYSDLTHHTLAMLVYLQLLDSSHRVLYFQSCSSLLSSSLFPEGKEIIHCSIISINLSSSVLFPKSGSFLRLSISPSSSSPTVGPHSIKISDLFPGAGDKKEEKEEVMDSGYSWDGSTNELGVKSIDQYCHGPECSGSRRAPVESMAVVQSPWRPWTPTDSHAKEERAHMRGGPAKKRTKRKEQAPPRGGPSSRSMQMVTTQGLER
ncbi:uncharacterized protein UDID_19030 [Ustilago sp. UG-2017a]|nr:uncharacterized protein UDID_19030 [Ustilago sp. UG-2017a]